jgi:hypothetical protein
MLDPCAIGSTGSGFYIKGDFVEGGLRTPILSSTQYAALNNQQRAFWDF